ncbi:MAG: ATP-binding protein [Flavobacterium sp.]|nr:MAG: ATP-binding protein [Flavobacterium sp.]
MFLLRYKNAKIINHIRGVVTFTNPLLLEIIIQNLVDNALKYNLSESPNVKIFTEQKDEMLSIYFQDNGIGIATQYVDKLFDPFNRINEMETAMGSGLGLTITKLAAIKMNADIMMVSGDDGCVFRLNLPTNF